MSRRLRAAMTRDVAIVGSGFAGTILARALARRGHRVVVLEKGRHPRFALGESSTPLAAASLERLARGLDLPDLHDLAAYGRWIEAFPGLRRGLKRGFTFYHHPPEGGPYVASPNTRLLVAASPTDRVADAHWLRSDVDHHLVRRAREEGVEILEGVTVTGIRRTEEGFVVEGESSHGHLEIETRRLVDASGPTAVVARELGARTSRPRLPPRGLAYAHLDELPEFHDLLEASPPAGPYPDERSAVHHLLPGGWFYRLPFDHGVSSCGLLLETSAWRDGPDPTSDPGTAVIHQLRHRSPTLARQIEGAEAVVPWRWVPEIAHRLDRGHGEGWLALPHAYAFFDPLFSTGIAWSLRAIERIVDLFEERQHSLDDYGELLAREADRIEGLVRLAWRALPHPRAFQAVTLLYFAAASFQESRERLLDPPPGGFAWEGFLGVGDPVVNAWLEVAEARLAADPDGFWDWVRRVIVPRDVAGLTEPARQGLYPVDFEDVVRGAGKLGLVEDTVRARIERLRTEAGLPARG